MPDYSYVEECSKRFNEALKIFHSFRSQLSNDRLTESSSLWFHVTDGNKPWTFNVDWVGRTYQFSMTADIRLVKGDMHLSHPCIHAYLVESTPNEVLLHELRKAVIMQGSVKIEGCSNYYSPSSDATLLFFALIGLPLPD